MRFSSRKALVLGMVSTILAGCGGDIPFRDEVAKVQVSHRVQPAQQDVLLSARRFTLTHAERWALHRWILGIYLNRWLEGLKMQVPSQYSDATWHRIATCETGHDEHAHGSRYSSAFGILNGSPSGSGGVWDMADDDASARRILAGAATWDEQLRMAKREANRFGIRAWAPGTLRCAGIA